MSLFNACSRTASFAVALALGAIPTLANASVASTPVPGGANQVAGVVGSLHTSSLFNGQVRVRKMALTKLDGSSTEDYGAIEGQRWLVFRALMSNGQSHPADMQQFTATLSDADGVSIDASPDKVRPMGGVYGIAPGGAWRESILFQVPAGFKPVKLVLVPNDRHFKAFRIAIAAADVPTP